MKHFYRFLIFLSLAFSFGIQNAFSAGIMASDLMWSCVGKDSFIIKLVLYRDCNDTAPGSEILKLYCSKTDVFLISGSFSKPAPVDITPVCNGSCTRCSNINCSFPYGIEQYTYHALVVIPVTSCCEIKIKFRECCRNNAITTISAGLPFYTEATLNRCISPCDNSPEFSNPPVHILCIGQDFVRGPDFSDPDTGPGGGLLDSLAFEWTDPMQDSATNISYNGGYTYDKPIYFWGFPNTQLPFPRGFHLEIPDGLIEFMPMKIEQTIMTLKVSEYRYGTKIGEQRREMQVIVINCPTNHSPSLGPAIYYKEVCAGNPVSFVINTNDMDPVDTLNIWWNHGIPGAIWSDNNGLVQHPTGIFTWTPGINWSSNRPYSFTVTVKDDVCPVSGYYTHAYQILVKPIPRAAITITDSGSGNYWFKARCLQGAGPTYSWSGSSFTFTSDNGPLVYSHFSSPGKYPFQMTITAQGCWQTYNDTVIADTLTSIIDEKPHRISIFPVPSDNSVVIRNVDKSDLIKTIILTNSSGQQVQFFDKVNSNEFILHKTGLKKGIYYLEIWLAGGKTILRKVVFE